MRLIIFSPDHKSTMFLYFIVWSISNTQFIKKVSRNYWYWCINDILPQVQPHNVSWKVPLGNIHTHLQTVHSHRFETKILSSNTTTRVLEPKQEILFLTWREPTAAPDLSLRRVRPPSIQTRSCEDEAERESDGVSPAKLRLRPACDGERFRELWWAPGAGCILVDSVDAIGGGKVSY